MGFVTMLNPKAQPPLDDVLFDRMLRRGLNDPLAHRRPHPGVRERLLNRARRLDGHAWLAWLPDFELRQAPPDGIDGLPDYLVAQTCLVEAQAPRLRLVS